MSAVELTIRGDIDVLRLQPGDALVVTVDRRITQAQASELRAALLERFPDHEVFVCAGDVRLTVQRDES